MSEVLSAGWQFGYCPGPPDWRIDWEALLQFKWLSELASCKQDEKHHAEGNVLIHTQMVCEALCSLQEWRSLSESERAIVFLSALFHDVAKPLVTKLDSERITSFGHTAAGARQARKILWVGKDFVRNPPPLHIREAVANMVRLSGLPFWLLEKNNPQRSVIRASYVVNCNWLAIMAKADALGRECQDKNALLEKVELFRDFCAEHDCLDKPFEFPSDHSRFSYFRDNKMHRPRQVYDDSCCLVTVLCGLPGAGKNTWISLNMPEHPVVSLDEIRQQLKVEPDDNQARVIAEARRQATSYLKKQESFVWNATNVTRFTRDSVVDLLRAYKANVSLVYVEPMLFADLLRRNEQRQAYVPRKVIDRLIAKLEVPDLTEAHELHLIIT